RSATQSTPRALVSSGVIRREHYTSPFVNPPAHPRAIVAPEVRDALDTGRGVVALETTLLVHCLPPEDAARVGAALENAVREHGAVPATVGMVDGVAVVGLDRAEVRRLVERRDVV